MGQTTKLSQESRAHGITWKPGTNSQDQCCTCWLLPVPSCCQSSCCVPHLFKTNWVSSPCHLQLEHDQDVSQLLLCPVPERLQHHQVSVDSPYLFFPSSAVSATLHWHCCMDLPRPSSCLVCCWRALFRTAKVTKCHTNHTEHAQRTRGQCIATYIHT